MQQRRRRADKKGVRNFKLFRHASPSPAKAKRNRAESTPSPKPTPEPPPESFPSLEQGMSALNLKRCPDPGLKGILATDLAVRCFAGTQTLAMAWNCLDPAAFFDEIRKTLSAEDSVRVMDHVVGMTGALCLGDELSYGRARDILCQIATLVRAQELPSDFKQRSHEAIEMQLQVILYDKIAPDGDADFQLEVRIA